MNALISATLRLIRQGALCVTVLILGVQTLSAAPYPSLSGQVVDQADVLSRSTTAQLTRELRSHREQYGDHVVLATVQSLDGVNIAQYALGLARHWQLGQSGADNGVLILIAPEDRKMRIEVGYGLERTLTDARARSIIEQDIRPRLRDGDFDSGAAAGVRGVLDTLRNPGAAGTGNTTKNTLTMAIPVVFAGLLALAHFFRRQVGKRAINILVMSGAIGMVANTVSERWYIGAAVGIIAALVLHKRRQGRINQSYPHTATDVHPQSKHYANPEDPTEYQETGGQRSRRGGSRPGDSAGGGGGGFGGGGASGGW